MELIMNKFDKRYTIRLAKIQDIDNIMNFIGTYWCKNHIMSEDKKLFQYEYEDNGNINFILAIDKHTNLIEAIFGFIRCSHTNDNSKKDIWGSMWKVNDSHDNIPLLGIELAKRVFSLTGCRMHIGNGANPNTTIPLRKLYFGDKTVKMKQYYYLNPNRNDYKIAIINQNPLSSPLKKDFSTKLVEFFCLSDLKKCFDVERVNALPYKDNWYIDKRYFHHLYYHYHIYGLSSVSNHVKAIMVTREVKCNGSKILRIVDYIGEHDLFSGLSEEFYTLLTNNNYEYIDFYTYGFKEESILKAGFSLRTEEDKNIIPNYFEPFLQENIDIWAHYKLDGTLFFKADGDQDRPNKIPFS